MNKFVYFMAVGLAFIALQVATVEASHDQAHVDEMRATEDSALDTARAAEDSARQTMRETEDNARQTRRDTEDRDRQAAADAMNAAAPTGGQHDCSEIPDAAGRALCETAEARGTPPTAAECALVGNPADCLSHAAGGGDGGDASCMPLADGSLPPHCN
jgi:hypothetical protein